MSFQEEPSELYQKLFSRNSHNFKTIQQYSKIVARKFRKKMEKIKMPNLFCISKPKQSRDRSQRQTTNRTVSPEFSLHDIRINSKPKNIGNKDKKLLQKVKKNTLSVKTPIHLNNLVFQILNFERPKEGVKKRQVMTSLPSLNLDRLMDTIVECRGTRI